MTKEGAERILGVPSQYTKGDLRQCYTAKAREYHPDTAAHNGLTPEQAQSRMTDVNKAYDFLKGQFEGANEDRVVVRGTWETAAAASGIESGFAGVDWRYGTGPDPTPSSGAHFRKGAGSGFGAYGTNNYGTYEGSESWNADVSGAADDDFWSFADEGASAADSKVPVTPRTVLLGPVVLRVAFSALFVWLWWRTFPLVGDNLSRYPVAAGSGTPDLLGVARLVAGLVYPTYLLAVEVVAGQVSGLVREVLNGLFSWASGTYYDLRPKSASYGCALSRMIRNQLWSVLMAPLVVWLAGRCVAAPASDLAQRVCWGALALALGVDMLAAVVRGGFVNIWTTALSERVEASYLMVRKRILERCGKWNERGR